MYFLISQAGFVISFHDIESKGKRCVDVVFHRQIFRVGTDVSHGDAAIEKQQIGLSFE